MKKSTVIWVVVVSLALAGPALAQPGPGGGMGPGKGPMFYNPQTVTTVTGQVEKLEELPSLGRGGGKGMHYRGVLLKTDQGSLMVDLAPGWYPGREKVCGSGRGHGFGHRFQGDAGQPAGPDRPGGHGEWHDPETPERSGAPGVAREGPGGGMGQGMRPGGGQGQGPPPR